MRVNGATVIELGTQVDPIKDRIEVDGRPLPRGETAHHYLALNKPIGLIESNWGGTLAEAWTPREYLENNPALKGLLPRQFKPGYQNQGPVL